MTPNPSMHRTRYCGLRPLSRVADRERLGCIGDGNAPSMTKGHVNDRLASAERRLNELLALNRGNLPGANASERQQLVQEFFFHLIGAIDVLAQVVNDARALGLDSEDVSVPAVVKRLSCSRADSGSCQDT
jgi:hypothetical protein